MLCIYFSIFLFRSNVRREYLDESGCKSFLITTKLTFFLQHLRNNTDNSILKDSVKD